MRAQRTNCKHCGGWGRVLKDVPIHDPDYGRTYPCPHCQGGQRGGIKYVYAGKLSTLAAQVYENMRFENFDTRVSYYAKEQNWALEHALSAAKNYASFRMGWLYIHGSSGSGKTHLASAIANTWAAEGLQVVFSTVPDMLDHLRVSYAPSSEQQYDDQIDGLMRVPHLILDDLGAENASPWAREKLYQLLNQRYINHLPTVITSNMSFFSMDERISSRLRDNVLVHHVRLELPDFRVKDDPFNLEAMGIIPNDDYQRLTLASYRTDIPEIRILASIKHQLEAYVDNPDGWLILIGGHGSGKTHAAAAVLNEWRSNHAGMGLHISTATFLDYLRSSFHPGTTQSLERRFNLLTSLPIVALDDFGISDNSSAWAREKLQQFLDIRYLRQLPTILCLHPSALRKLHEANDPIYSRLGDNRMMHWITLPAEDLRRWEWD